MVFIILSIGCKEQDHADHAGGNDYYTCPMHPTIRKNAPGVCPICNMNLVKASTFAQDTSLSTIQIVEEQQSLANIKTDTVRVDTLSETLVLLGTVESNQNTVSVITSRSQGRIEKLNKRNPGETVRKGELLYTLYSEELLGGIREYLSLLVRKDKYQDENETVKSLLAASKQKLLYAGISAAQLNSIESKREVNNSISFYSDVDGTITEIPVKEGAYVETGSIIYSITDLSSLWVTTEFYSNEVSMITTNSTEIEIEGKKYKGNPELINPQLESNTKINLVKFRIENKDQHLRPGMMARVRLEGKNGKGIVIPKKAILYGKMPMIWVQTNKELFEYRMIKTGMQSKEKVQVLEGLEPGELLVIEGAYLVNSEFILKKGQGTQHVH